LRTGGSSGKGVLAGRGALAPAVGTRSPGVRRRLRRLTVDGSRGSIRDRQALGSVLSAEGLSAMDPEELARVTGGYDEGNWCGTHPPGWHPLPLPHPVSSMLQ
jgi:hypothetical protein